MTPTMSVPRTTGNSSCGGSTERCRASARVSAGESVMKSVIITSITRTRSSTACKNHAAVFQLRGQEEKDSRHHDPEIVRVGAEEDRAAAEEQRQGEELPDGNGAPGGRDLISAARQHRAQNASAIQRIGGQQVERGHKQLCPGQAARQDRTA